MPCCTSHPSWQGTFPGQWALQLERTIRVTHTGADERITGTSVTIIRNWLKEGVHDIGCCGDIAGLDKHLNFLVRGSCRVHSVSGGCRFLIHFQACRRIAAGTGIHRVRQRSDVDLVEKSASKVGDNTSVTWPRDVTVSVARDGHTKSPNATYGMSMMLRPALTEALGDAAQHAKSRRNS